MFWSSLGGSVDFNATKFANYYTRKLGLQSSSQTLGFWTPWLPPHACHTPLPRVSDTTWLGGAREFAFSLNAPVVQICVRGTMLWEPPSYKITVIGKPSMTQGCYFESPHVGMTLRKDQAMAGSVIKTLEDRRWTTKSRSKHSGWWKLVQHLRDTVVSHQRLPGFQQTSPGWSSKRSCFF